MGGDAEVRACFTNRAEPCEAIPLAKDDALNESGCTSATRLSVAAKELAPAQEIEAIAAVARRMGHDLNNLLAIIMTFTQLALEDLEPGDPLRTDLEEVSGAAERARDIARQLAVLGDLRPGLARPI